jgi:hypothetical protein
MLSFGLPLAVPGLVDSDPNDPARKEDKPRTASQLYREVDRLMTTLVRSSEVNAQVRS